MMTPLHDTARTALNQIRTTTTYQQIAEWDSQAARLIKELHDEIAECNMGVSKRKAAIEALKASHAKKSIIARAFANQSEQRQLVVEISKLQAHIAESEPLIVELQDASDLTPNDKPQRDALVAELKQRRKELQLNKREAAANLRAVRVEAHHQSTVAGKDLLGSTYNAKSASHERRQIRYARMEVVRPHEDAKAAIERQIIEIDRDTLWLSGITEM